MAVTVPSTDKYSWNKAISDDALKTLFRINSDTGYLADWVNERNAGYGDGGDQAKPGKKPQDFTNVQKHRAGFYLANVSLLVAGLGGIFLLSSTNKGAQTAGGIIVQSSARSVRCWTPC